MDELCYNYVLKFFLISSKFKGEQKHEAMTF